MTKMGSRYKVVDLKTKSEYLTDDLSEALFRIDILHKQMNHHTRMTNTQNGESFDWEAI